MTDDTQSSNPSQNNFDCNICLFEASEPIVTRCGHLYCANCVAQWLRTSDACPVCKEHTDTTTIVPIYGRGRQKSQQQSSTAAMLRRSHQSRRSSSPPAYNSNASSERHQSPLESLFPSTSCMSTGFTFFPVGFLESREQILIPLSHLQSLFGLSFVSSTSMVEDQHSATLNRWVVIISVLLVAVLMVS